jgi:hypothetical protein
LHRLSNQESTKGIAVECGKARQMTHRSFIHRKSCNSMSGPLLRQILRRCAREREFTEIVLDDCFPNRDGTQIDVIGRILDCCLKTCWQPGISGDVSKKDMSI